ncbi:MAG: hypothetical protein J6N80_04275 [Bacteroidales bacterium]|nr:hypothetical protein [Bacteroidales bacterium]
MTQQIINSADSLGVFHPETIEKANWSLSQFFIQGGPAGMIIITLFLIALLVAAWKAPRWVKEIGIGALVASIFWTLRGLFQVFDLAESFGDIPFNICCGGFKVAMISTLYGLIVYFISLVIRIIQKPRI